MTEKEARMILDVRISRFDHAGDVNEALETAKQALEEIQKYREIGTIEECREAVEKLARYEDLEQDSRLLELPCKVGDTVYIINTLLSGKKLIVELEADAFFIALCMIEKRFGETVFLSEEAAEAALKERSR